MIHNYKHTENAFLPKVVTVQLKQDKKCNYLCLVKAGDFVQEGDVIAIPDREAESFAKIDFFWKNLFLKEKENL